MATVKQAELDILELAVMKQVRFDGHPKLSLNEAGFMAICSIGSRRYNENYRHSALPTES